MENPEERPNRQEPNNGGATAPNPKKGKKQNNRRRQQNRAPRNNDDNNGNNNSGKNNNDIIRSASNIANKMAAVKLDENLCSNVAPDPRGECPERRMTKKSADRNTSSFDPSSTLVRPALRVQVGSPTAKSYNRFPLKHDDVVIVPELFGAEDDWELYYKLVEEMTNLQQQNVRGSEWLSWHEGAHLVAKNPNGSETFQEMIDKLCDYFQIQKKSIGTRFIQLVQG